MKVLRSILNLLRFNRKNWKAVVLCFFAATVFWFFNALNKSYTANVSFPLAFDYNHENYVAISPLPEEVRLNVSGVGWNLFRRSSGVKVPPLVIPLDRPSEVKKIVGSALPGFFSNQLEGLQINFVITDTLFINVQPKAGRWLKLSIDSAQLSLDRNYTLASDVKMVPESVFVEGPMSLVTTLEEPTRIKIDDQNIDADFRQDVKIDLGKSNLINCNPSTVFVTFDVQRYVQVSDSVKLVILNPPPRSRPWIERDKIPLAFEIPENASSGFSADSVKAIIDLKGFQHGDLKVVPKIIGLPKYSRIVKVDSIRIHY